VPAPLPRSRREARPAICFAWRASGIWMGERYVPGGRPCDVVAEDLVRPEPCTLGQPHEYGADSSSGVKWPAMRKWTTTTARAGGRSLRSPLTRAVWGHEPYCGHGLPVAADRFNRNDWPGCPRKPAESRS
jgi:hypothetical protein